LKFYKYFILFFVFKSLGQATDYFVSSSYGDDTNNGLTIGTPFKTIVKAASIMSSGDICYIRQGRYHETITINNLDGTSSSPIIFTNYNNERVVIDGTIPITSTWTQIGSSNLWRTKLTQDIWQLFINWEEQVMARWPNAKFSDGSIWDNDNYWAKGTIDDDENAYSNGSIIDDPYTNSSGTLISLSSTSFDLDEANKQAIAILNLGSFRTWSRLVTNHSGNTFNYGTVPSWKTKHHYYYLEGRKEFLDQEGEWWYDMYNNNDSLYYFAANGVNPNKLDFRGKVQSYAFSITGSEYLHIKNLEFFGTTVYFSNGDNCLVYGCNFMYPSCSKRMLRVVDTEPEMTKFASGSSGSTIRRCAFRNTDGTALEMWGGTDTVDNCYFNNIDYSVADNSSIMLTLRMNGTSNVFRKNTIHKTGASATIMIGDAGLAEYNNLYDTGHLQSDGAMIQFMEDQQDGAICRYNWLHDTEKYGARFDHSGDADGTNGIMHHNLAWNCESGGIMIKGNNHKVYNNTVLNSGAKNDIIIFQVNSSDHSNTIVKNNAADKIANHRVNDVEINFGTYTNNWNGYKESITLNSILEDTSNSNFSPTSGSPLIDAGTIITNITDQYTNNGTAPDIGAYENGNTNWTAGHDWNLGSTFGNSWIPMHNVSISGNSGFRMMSSPVSGTILADLLDELWLQGMTGGDIESGNANVWFLDLAAQSWSQVNNIATQSLTAGQGFLIYVFEDCDNNGDNDLPLDLFVSGNHNQNNVTINSIPQNSYFLAGNPYTKTIDWDDISKTNLSAVISVWDDASSDWKTYNGTSGDLTNGLIAPFQGFWVQASGGVGSFTIQTDDIAASSTSFIRSSNENNNFINLSFSNVNNFDNIFFTFDSTTSIINYDFKDAFKLAPLNKSPRIAAMIINENKTFKINSLPLHFDSTMVFPLQILSLDVDSIGNYLAIEDSVNLHLNEINLPENINVHFFDNFTGYEYTISEMQEISIVTDSLGVINFESNSPLNQYINYGNHRYFIYFSNIMLTKDFNEIITQEYQLFQNYPNPFNPNTKIIYNMPKKEFVKITIYDMLGREVKTLVNEIQNAGLKTVHWNGLNDNNKKLSSGLYLYYIETENFRKTKKMLLLK
tara:strand:+ start:555 stop:3908 length:3354 start_codon:yes stop_codon:yes gene_type:complete